jgi:hypothetical protein
MLHQVGEREFFRKKGIDAEIVIAKLLMAYATYHSMSKVIITDAMAEKIHWKDTQK